MTRVNPRGPANRGGPAGRVDPAHHRHRTQARPGPHRHRHGSRLQDHPRRWRTGCWILCRTSRFRRGGRTIVRPQPFSAALPGGRARNLFPHWKVRGRRKQPPWPGRHHHVGDDRHYPRPDPPRDLLVRPGRGSRFFAGLPLDRAASRRACCPHTYEVGCESAVPVVLLRAQILMSQGLGAVIGRSSSPGSASRFRTRPFTRAMARSARTG